ncbi:MAG TPA: cystathionine beta-lyase [Xanthobacteraceae bacterium]|nr:cystathionine beta-lyase [Xanthobacteraceae bacterium]
MAKGGKHDGKGRKFHIATEVVSAGRTPFAFEGFVNTPIFRGSTVLAPSADQYLHKKGRYTYGRRGTPTTTALEGALTTLEGGAGVVLTPSGLSAISTALLSVLQSGDHLLVTDSAYFPTRHFCDTVLKKFGVETSYYDPRASAAIEKLLQPNTRAVFLEAPGSLSFEMQDVPAIAEIAHAHGAAVLMDNTWATPVYFKPHEFGVDLSLAAGTKYLGGHADVNLGWVSGTEKFFPALKEVHGTLGLCPGPEDVFLSLRGLRTLAVRLERHMASALTVATWLKTRPEVLRVLHPALSDDPGHAIWKRDFAGASGLFSFVLKPDHSAKAAAAFVDALELFGIGASWGGFESLAIPFDCTKMRSATKWAPGGPAIRLHIGLEDVDDLIADLERGFSALAQP